MVKQLNRLSLERYIQFLAIDMSVLGGDVYRFVDSSTFTNPTGVETVSFDGFSWTCFPFQIGGYQRGGENLVRPAIQVFDYTGEMYATMRTKKYGKGSPVTLYRAFADDIAAGIAGSPFPPEQYILYNVSKQGPTLEIQLATQIDFAALKFPGFNMTRFDFPGLGSQLLKGT